jgi:hypothetical protein
MVNFRIFTKTVNYISKARNFCVLVGGRIVQDTALL